MEDRMVEINEAERKKIMKKQRNTIQMKKQVRRSPNKWRGNRQTTWKIIQNNDSKDDPKSWKQNEITDK